MRWRHILVWSLRAVLVLGPVLVVGGHVESAAQQTEATSSVTTTTSPYKADPKGLVAHLDRVRRHSVGRDSWQVWVCELDGETMQINPEDVADSLQSDTLSYFKWLSDGVYNPVFVAGGEPINVSVKNEKTSQIVRACRLEGEKAILPSLTGATPISPDGVLIVINVDVIGPQGDASNGIGTGMAPGDPCLEANPAGKCDKFPSNKRVVYVAGGLVVGGSKQRPLLMAHEIGHTLGFPHSYLANNPEHDHQYNNPMDMMSNAVRRTNNPKVGTIAVNRYQAGWVDGDDVEVRLSGTATYALRPVGTSSQRSLLPVGRLPEMLAIGGTKGVFLSLGARAADGYDADIAKVPTGVNVVAGKLGVEAYVVNQRHTSEFCYLNDVDGACVAVMRRTEPVRPNAAATVPPTVLETDHVYRSGGEFSTHGHVQFDTGEVGKGVLPYKVQVVGHIGDGWLVRPTELIIHKTLPHKEVDGPFDDIKSNVCKYPIELLSTLTVSNGCRHTGKYCPAELSTRAHMAVFLVRALGHKPISENDNRQPSFKDVPKGHWAYRYIEKLKDLKVTNGCGNGTIFCPGVGVTRAQVAVLFSRAIGYDPLPVTDRKDIFVDVKDDQWAWEYILKLDDLMKDLSIVKDCIQPPKGRNFCPTHTFPRDHMAQSLTTASLTLQEAPPTTTVPATPPGMPRNVSVSSQWILTWDAPTTLGTGGITDYDLSYGIVSGSGWIGSVGTKTTVNLISLIAKNYGQQLYIRVRARNSHGASDWTTKTTITAPPRAPSNASAVSNTPGQVTLTWDAPADASASSASGGVTISSYKIQRKTSTAGDKFVDIATVSASSGTTYTDTGVVAGSKYSYRVYTINSAGLTSTTPSNVAEVTVQSPTTTTTTTTSTTTTTTKPKASRPGRVSNFFLSASPGSIRVSWSPPSTGGSPITRYDLMCQVTEGIGIGRTLSVPGSARSGTFSGLANGATYKVRIRAVNAQGNGPWSDWARATPRGGGSPR